MPRYAKRKSRKTTRKHSRKGSRKSVSRKRTYRHSKKRGPIRRLSRKRMRTGERADTFGATVMAAQVSDPGLLGMYRSIARSSGLSMMSTVNVPQHEPLPDIFNNHFTFISTQNNFAAAGAPAAILGNGLIEPFDIPTYGMNDPGRPAYVQELGALYQYYRVKSSTLHMRVVNTDPSQPVTAIIFPTLSPPATWAANYPTTLDEWIAFTGPHKTFTIGDCNSAKNWRDCVYTVSTSAIFNNDADVEDFAGTMPKGVGAGSNPLPSFLWYWGIIAFNADGTALTLSTVTFNVSVKYNTSSYQLYPSAEFSFDSPSLAPRTSALPTPPTHPTSAIPEDLEESIYVKVPKGSLKKV